MKIDKNLLKGIDEFNSGYFYESHDTLEEIWSEEVDQSDRIFYQGLIHIAVGFYHLTNYNLRGAMSQLTKGVKKLENYPASYKGIAIGDLIKEVKSWLEKVNMAVSGEDVEFDFDKIPKIKLVTGDENRQI